MAGYIYGINLDEHPLSGQQESPDSLPLTCSPASFSMGPLAPADVHYFFSGDGYQGLLLESCVTAPPSTLSPASDATASSSRPYDHFYANAHLQSPLTSGGEFEQGRRQWSGHLPTFETSSSLNVQVTHDAEHQTQLMFNENWRTSQTQNAAPPYLLPPSSQGVYPLTLNPYTTVPSQGPRLISPGVSAVITLYNLFVDLSESEDHSRKITRLAEYFDEVETKFPFDILSAVCICFNSTDMGFTSSDGSPTPPTPFSRFLLGLPKMLGCIRHAVYWQRNVIGEEIPRDPSFRSVLFTLLCRLFDVLARNTSRYWTELDPNTAEVVIRIFTDLRDTLTLSVDAAAMSLPLGDRPFLLATMENFTATARNNLHAAPGWSHPALKKILEDVQAHFETYKTTAPHARIDQQGPSHDQQLAPPPFAQEAGPSSYHGPAPSNWALGSTSPMLTQPATAPLMGNAGMVLHSDVGSHSTMRTDTTTNIAPDMLRSRVARSGPRAPVPSTLPPRSSNQGVAAEAGTSAESYPAADIHHPSTNRSSTKRRRRDPTESLANEDGNAVAGPSQPRKRTRTTKSRRR